MRGVKFFEGDFKISQSVNIFGINIDIYQKDYDDNNIFIGNKF